MWDSVASQNRESISMPSVSPPPNPDVLQTLAEKRTTRDGNLPKRRGPKPNSKPALTRRQELNRQAQRTHRERKELYLKALEDEVLRLRETFSRVSIGNDRLAEENKYLKNLLTQHGIAIPTSKTMGFALSSTEDDSAGYALTPPSASGNSYTHGSRRGLTPPLTSQSTSSSMSPPSRGLSSWSMAKGGPRPTSDGGLDYNQAGIDFVLTLEQPCMSHLPWLLDHVTEKGGRACGHALMASCPPRPFGELDEDVPFGLYNNDLDPATACQQTWRPSHADLATLLDLSRRLDLDGEITPVMSWSIIMSHPKFFTLQREDFTRLAQDLKDKVRCYGFGAVLEEFEIRDALENVL